MLADINAVNKTGNTALHYANQYQFANVSKMLIARGAKREAVNAANLRCSQGIGKDRRRNPRRHHYR